MKTKPLVIASICTLAFASPSQAQQAEVNTGGATGSAKITPLTNTEADAKLKCVFEDKTVPAPKAEVKKESVSHSSSSSSSSSQNSSTTTINGKTVNITRTIDGDGKETVKITTFSRSGKPKVEEMSAEEFDAKYNKKKSKAAKADKAAKPAPADNGTPVPAATGKATE